MAVGSNRMLGGIGALLLVVSAISPLLSFPLLFGVYSTGFGVYVFSPVLGLAGLAGIVLFMIAMRRFASDYKNIGIFNNALYGLLSSIVVAAVAGGLMVIVMFINLSSMLPAFNPVPGPNNLFQPILGYVVPVLPVSSVAGLVQALFMMRAFNLLAVKSEVRLFRTAGLALVAGSVLVLILVCVGVLLFFAVSISAVAVLVMLFAGTTVSYLAWILAAKAFFSIKAPTSQTQPALPIGQVKYCSQCRAENLPDAVFCTRCGKKL